MTEHWIELDELPRYAASSTGQIFDKKLDRLVSQSTDSNGYKRVHIQTENGRLTMSVHRLIASAFYDADISDLEINHADGDKANNHISNLEIMTRAENMRHAYANRLVHMPKETEVVCVETGKKYRTLREAARDIGAYDHKSILRILDKPQYSCKGLHFVTA